MEDLIERIDVVKTLFRKTGGNGLPELNTISGQEFQEWLADIKALFTQVKSDPLTDTIDDLTDSFNGWSDETNFEKLTASLKAVYKNHVNYFRDEITTSSKDSLVTKEVRNIKSLISASIKENGNSIITILGEIKSMKQIGQGGNGLVYSGQLNGKDVAVKFLTEAGKRKLDRFKAEYYNVKLLPNNKDLVKYINYEELRLESELNVPIIIMQKYHCSLKDFRNNNDPNHEVLKQLFIFLVNTLEFIHDNGIIHRDIKPENILVSSDGTFVLADFGIAYYNPEMYELKAETQNGERLANYDFSAPEQSVKGIKPSVIMDIYSLGQICQWYCFGKTHKGTNRKRITEIFDTDTAKIIDLVINKCLYNDPSERFQNIQDVKKFYEETREKLKEPDPYDEMQEFSEAIRSSFPQAYGKPTYITNSKVIERLINVLGERKFKRPLWFNTGKGNNEIYRLEYLEKNKMLLNHREINVDGIWLYSTSNLYDDLILIKWGETTPYLLGNEEHNYVSIINGGEFIIPSYKLEAGYVEIDEKIYCVDELKVDDRSVYKDYEYIAIGTVYHCTIIQENDGYLRQIQDKTLNEDEVKQLVTNISRKKHVDVSMRI